MWFPHRPDWHELVYSDGDPERVPGRWRMPLHSPRPSIWSWSRRPMEAFSGTGRDDEALPSEIPIPEDDDPSPRGVLWSWVVLWGTKAQSRTGQHPGGGLVGRGAMSATRHPTTWPCAPPPLREVATPTHRWPRRLHPNWDLRPWSRRRWNQIISQMSGDGDPALVEVIWRRFGQHVFLTYAEGGSEHMEGDLSFATAMAESAGLELIDSSPAVAHWVRDPKTSHISREL